MTKSVIFALTVFIIVLFAAIGYFIFQNQKIISQLASQSVSKNIQSTPTPTPNSPSPSPSPTLLGTRNAIAANINSKTYAKLIPLMQTPKINFSLMSSECCQPQTPAEATARMNYISEGVPMDFNQENPTIKNLKSKNSQLTGAYMGISTTKEHLAAFTIDSDNKISAIQLAVTWKLYEQ